MPDSLSRDIIYNRLKLPSLYFSLLAYGTLSKVELNPVNDVIFAPNDTISVQKCNDDMLAVIRGAHKIPKKKKQGIKGNTSGIFHRRLHAEVARSPP